MAIAIWRSLTGHVLIATVVRGEVKSTISALRLPKLAAIINQGTRNEGKQLSIFKCRVVFG
jgi:hypothetical protein